MKSITGAILILAAVVAAGTCQSDVDLWSIPLGIFGLAYFIADWRHCLWIEKSDDDSAPDTTGRED